MWNDLLTALALVLVLEGIMPFINPAGLRKMIVVVAVIYYQDYRTNLPHTISTFGV